MALNTQKVPHRRSTKQHMFMDSTQHTKKNATKYTDTPSYAIALNSTCAQAILDTQNLCNKSALNALKHLSQTSLHWIAYVYWQHSTHKTHIKLNGSKHTHELPHIRPSIKRHTSTHTSPITYVLELHTHKLPHIRPSIKQHTSTHTYVQQWWTDNFTYVGLGSLYAYSRGSLRQFAGTQVCLLHWGMSAVW